MTFSGSVVAKTNLHVLRRLLDDLEQRVEALAGDHVGLVDDVDLVARRRRREEGPLPQVACVVDTAVAGGVDLDDVQAAAALAGEVLTGLAVAARRRGRPLLAVQAAGQDAGAGGLAAAARPAEQVGVVDALVGQRLLERLGDVALADDVGERLGAVAAVERLGHGRTLFPGRDRWHRAKEDPSHTRQSLPTLAAFRPWGSSAGWRRTRGRIESNQARGPRSNCMITVGGAQELHDHRAGGGPGPCILPGGGFA